MNCQTRHRQLKAPASSLSSLGSSSFTKPLSTSNHSTERGETCPLEAMNAHPFWIHDESPTGKSKKNRQPAKKERTRMTFFSKMFSGQTKAAASPPPRKGRKSVIPSEAPASPGTTATTGYISGDATKFFEERREKEAKRDQPRRQQSHDSLLGAILDIPTNETTATKNNKSSKKNRRHSITNGCNNDDPSTFLPSTALPSQKSTFLPSTALPPQKSYRIVSINTSNESPCRSTKATSSRVHHSVTSARDLTFEDLSSMKSVVVPKKEDDAGLLDPVVEATVDKSDHRAHDRACHSANGLDTSSACPCIEISPGFSLPLRGSQETLRAVRQRKIATSACLSCGESVHAIQDAAMIICPTCRTINPLNSTNGYGIALGFATWDLQEIQQAAYAMTKKCPI